MTAGAPFRYRAAGDGVRVLAFGPPAGSPTVFCLPCAGGVAGSFRALAGQLPPSWRVLAIDPPGHGFNDAPLLDAIEPMVERYLRAIEPDLHGDCYLLGHSMGGLVAYLMARRLERAGRPVRGVIVCGVRGPRRVTDAAWSDLPDAELTARLAAVGGVPAAFLDAPETFHELLPPIRADFRALERFRFEPGPPLETPLLAVATADDRFVPPERVREWIGHAANGRFHVLPTGGHFFPQGEAPALARLVTELHRDPARTPLGDDLHVWLVDPDAVDDAELAGCRALLCPTERARHAGFVVERARRQFVIARAALRTALSRYLDLPPTTWRFTTGAHGRPELACVGARPLTFNVSHTDGLIAIAVAREGELGVDVEDHTRPTRAVELADQLFAPAEQARVRAAAPDRRRDAFYGCWTLKEAYLKARGLGLTVPADQCAFDVDAQGAVTAHLAPALDDRAADWQLAQLRPTPRHLLALAARRASGAPRALRLAWSTPLAGAAVTTPLPSRRETR
jgi:4'-phosphopantetheinyl transferase